MDKKLELQLLNEFPQFFEDLYGDCRQTCMSWGVECDAGWFDLIHDTCLKISKLNPPPEFKFVQIKEKFASLRLYATCCGSDEIQKVLDEAEEKSYKICEVCGKEGKVTGFFWLKTLCENCENQRD